MAYESASESGYGAGPSVIHADASRADAISISDAELLFTGHLERKGPDLVLTGRDGHHHIIAGYFSAAHHADLVAPNGARITGDLVDLLAGSPAPGQYAQTQPTVATDAIGRIEKVVGNVTVMRNGVAVAVHVGDAVYKNDVVQTGADSSAGVGFADGTALNLVANTRMALNDYVYDPNGSSNVALFNLVQGGFAFVAGKVAHTGDMKIGTPVATMGIRGTTGYALEQVATVNANVGNVTMSFAVVADPGSDRVGMYDLIDQFGNIVAQVGRAGVWTNLSFQGANQPPTVTTQAMTAANFSIEQALVPALVQILNNINNLSPAPQSGPNNPGSSTPPIFLINLQQYLQQNGNTQVTVNIPVNGANGPTTAPGTVAIGATGTPETATVNWTSLFGGNWEQAANWSDFSLPKSPQFARILHAVKVTIDSAESASGLFIGKGAILNIVSGGALELQSGVANFGSLQINSSGTDPTLAINGAVFLLNNGTVALTGPTDENLIVGVAGTGATLVNVNNTIIGSGTIGQGDGALILVNGADGTIEAMPLVAGNSGRLIIDTGNPVSNSGVLMAGAGGTLQIDDSITNFGTIGASGHDAVVDLEAVHIFGGTLETDTGGVIETLSGVSTFSHVTIADGSFIETGAGTALRLQGSTILDGTVTFEGTGTFKLPNAGAEITGEAHTHVELDNFGTIDGEGKIGAGDRHFVLVNKASGVIDASGQQALIIDNDSPGSAGTQPSNAVINTGLIEASGAGGLTIENTTISNATDAAHDTGHVHVFADSQITLDNATILHGFVSIATGGEILTARGTTNTIETADGQDNLSTVTLDNHGTLLVRNNSSLTLASPDAIDNAGTIQLDSTGHATLLYFDQPDAGINGGGQIVLSDNSNNVIAVTQNGDQLTNFDNTISGAGNIGEGGMVLVDGGMIDADYPDNELILDPTSLTNTGVLEATNNATLLISNTTVTNSGAGTITATPGTTVDLENATIIDGTVNIAGVLDSTGTSAITNAAIDNTGTIESTAGTFTVGLTTLTNAGTLKAIGGSTFTLNADSLTNDSGAKIIASGHSSFNVTDNASTNLGIYEATGHSTLTVNHEGAAINELGGIIEAIDGTIVLNDNLGGANYGAMYAADRGTIDLIIANTNAPPQSGNHATIEAITDGDFVVTGDFLNWSGANVLADGHRSQVDFSSGNYPSDVTNDGTITAADHGEVSFDHVHVINENTIEASSDGTIDFVDSTVNNSGGTIKAADAGASIQLSYAEIDHGTLSIGARDSLDVETPGAKLAGVSVINRGIIDVNGGILDVTSTSTIKGPGQVVISGGGTADFQNAFDQNVTFQGAGTLAFADPADFHAHTLIAGLINGDTIDLTNIAPSDIASVTIDRGVGTSTLVVNETGGATLNFTIAGNLAHSEFLTSADNGGGTDLVLTRIKSVSWLSPDDGNWANGAKWSSGKAPTGNDAVTIGPFSGSEHPNRAFTVEIGSDLGSKHSPYSLTLDDAHATVNDQGILTLQGGMSIVAGTFDLAGGILQVAGSIALDRAGKFDVTDNSTVTGTTFNDTASGSILTVDGGDTLTLNAVTIDSGKIDGTNASEEVLASTIGFTGDSSINNAVLKHGHVTVANGVTLTLDGDTVKHITFNDAPTGTIDVTGDSTISDAVLKHGHVTVADDVTLSIEGAGTQTTFDHVAVQNSGTIQVDNGNFPVDLVLTDGTTLTGGTLSIGPQGEVEIENGPHGSGAMIDSGITMTSGSMVQIDTDATLTVRGAVTGTGSFTIEDGAALEFGRSVDAGVAVSFAANSGTLAVSKPAHFDANITGLVDGDTIDLTNIHPHSIASAAIVGSQLVVEFNNDRPQLALDISGNLTDSQFVVESNHHGGTDLVLEAVDTWTNDNGDYTWSDRGNWSAGSPPVPAQEAVIPADNNPTIYSDVTLYNVTVQDAGAITVASGATLTLDDGTTIIGGGTGTLTIDFGNNTLDIEAGTNGSGATLDGVSVYDNAALDIGDVTSGAILTLDDGAAVSGGGTGTLTINAGNTLDIKHGANGPGSGATLDGVGVSDYGTVEIGRHAVLTLEGGTSISGNGSFVDHGSVVANGSVDVGVAVTGTGSFTIDSGATLELGGTSTNGVTFASTGAPYGVLILDDPTGLSGQITGFTGTAADTGHSDEIVLQNFDPASLPEAVNYSGGITTLTVSDSSNPSLTDTLYFVGDYTDNNTTDDFKFVQNGSNLDIFDPPAASATIDYGDKFVVRGPSSEKVKFAGDDATLVLRDPTLFDGRISGIADSTDIIDLKHFHAADTAVTATYHAHNHTTTLNVTDSADHQAIKLILDGYYPSDGFYVTSYGHGGADLVNTTYPWDGEDGVTLTLATAHPQIAIPEITQGTMVDFPILGGETVEVTAATSATLAGLSTTVFFYTGTGSLVLDNPESFTGTIEGFTGTAPNTSSSDVIDLVGINYNSGDFSESYNSTTGVLTVNDGTNTAALTFADFTGTFEFASDGSGGTDIFDPPAKSSGPSVSASSNDTFVFHSGTGAETAANFNPHADTIELDNFNNIHSVHQLASLITTDAQGDAVIGLGHHDSITLPGVGANYLQAHLHSLVHLG